jgi:hypothetical protein
MIVNNSPERPLPIKVPTSAEPAKIMNESATMKKKVSTALINLHVEHQTREQQKNFIFLIHCPRATAT